MSDLPTLMVNRPELTPLGIPLELRCGACKRSADYPVNHLILDPVVVKSEENIGTDAYGFTGYFHCKFCGAAGPWEFPPSSMLLMIGLMRRIIANEKDVPLNITRTMLQDGFVFRWPTQAEAHLKELIAKDRKNYFLYNRLGNLYKTGEAFELATDAYTQALKYNEHDIDSLQSLAQIHEHQEDREKAAEFYRQVLYHARQAPTPPANTRVIVAGSVYGLYRIQQALGNTTAVFPNPGPPGTPPVLELIHPNRAADYVSLVDLWFPLSTPQPRPQAKGKLIRIRPSEPDRPPTSSLIGRNDPCPCGSGKKFKACCIRKSKQ